MAPSGRTGCTRTSQTHGTPARRPSEKGRETEALPTKESAKERKGHTPARRPVWAPAAAEHGRLRRTWNTAAGTPWRRTAEDLTRRTTAPLAARKWEGARETRDSCGGAPATRVSCQGSEATEAPASTWSTTTVWKNLRRMLGNAGSPIRAARGATRAGTPGRGIAPPPATHAGRRPETGAPSRPARSATEGTRRRSEAGQTVRAPQGRRKVWKAGATQQTEATRHPAAGPAGRSGHRRTRRRRQQKSAAGRIPRPRP
jgi:hypothetical protein